MSFTTTFPPDFVKAMKLYCLQKNFVANQLIEKAVRDYMKLNPVTLIVRLQREWDISASRLRDSWSRC